MLAVESLLITAWAQAATAQRAESLNEPQRGQAKQGVTERSGTKCATYYSMQLSNPPPMPFNPFPDLPVYEVGEGRFLYDDRDVDYERLRVASRPLR